MNDIPTKEQIRAAIEMIAAVGQLIKELGTVPSGHLYARLMDKFTLSQYETIIDRLVAARLVKRDPWHQLTWVGGE